MCPTRPPHSCWSPTILVCLSCYRNQPHADLRTTASCSMGSRLELPKSTLSALRSPTDRRHTRVSCRDLVSFRLVSSRLVSCLLCATPKSTSTVSEAEAKVSPNSNPSRLPSLPQRATDDLELVQYRNSRASRSCLEIVAMVLFPPGMYCKQSSPLSLRSRV
jgi:hypothetical protein